MSHLFQLGETCVSPFSIPGSNTGTIDGNDKMKNKTATECWNILRGELDSAIDRYVPMKKQGKQSKKKHLSK